MKYLSKSLIFSGYTFVVMVLIAGLYLLTAYILSRISVNQQNASEKQVRIFILTNGVHTDLVMPLRSELMDWSKEFKFENTILKDTSSKFLALGWGDKGFYLETPTWGDLTFKTAFKATFWLGKSAIHSTFYKEMKEGKNCKRIDISMKQYSLLISYIKRSLTYNSSGELQIIKTKTVYGLNDAFYEANGKYSLFNTCNTWANNGLKSCGQKASLWTPFDTGIFYQYQ